MKNKLIILILFLFITTLHCAREQSSDETDNLIGFISDKVLFEEFPSWEENKITYQPNITEVEKISSLAVPVEVIVFIGTWCPDSKREVPKFLKIMELANNSLITTQIYGIDEEKADEQGLVEKYDIQYVPTDACCIPPAASG